MLRAKREWDTIAAYVTGGFAMAAAATAATLGVSSGNITAISSLSASSLFANDMFGLLKFREKAAAYQDGLSLVEQAESRFLRTSAKNHAQNNSSKKNKVLKNPHRYIGDVNDAIASESQSGSISSSELTIAGASLYTEVIASIQLVEKALIANIPTLAEVERATGKYSLFQVTPSNITLDSESQIQITVISGGMIKAAGSQDSNVIDVKPFNYQEGTKTITLIAKGQGETVVDITSDRGESTRVEVAIKELYVFFDRKSSDKEGLETLTEPNIILSLSTPASRNIKIALEVATTDKNHATVGKDYYIDPAEPKKTEFEIEFRLGEANKKIPLTILQDKTDDLEHNETVLISLKEQNIPIRGKRNFEYRITDSEDEPTLKFKISKSRFPEPQGKAKATMPNHKVEVVLSHKSEKKVIVPYSIKALEDDDNKPLQATAGEDFKEVHGTIEFDFPKMRPDQENPLSKEIAVTIHADDVDEDDQQFQIQFASESSENVVLDTTQTHQITIIDNIDDPVPEVGFAMPTSDVEEKSQEEKSLEVTLSGKSDNTVVIPYTAIDDTATKFVDYSLIGSELSIEPQKEKGIIKFKILDDSAYEGTEKFSIELKKTDIQYAKLDSEKKTNTVSITSDDTPTIGFLSFAGETSLTAPGNSVEVVLSSSNAIEKDLAINFKVKSTGETTAASNTYTISPASLSGELKIKKGTNTGIITATLITDVAEQKNITLILQSGENYRVGENKEIVIKLGAKEKTESEISTTNVPDKSPKPE